MTLKVLIDAANLHSGGGVQVASSFIEELFTSVESPEWLDAATVRVSAEVRRNLSQEVAAAVEARGGGARGPRPLSFARPVFDVAFRVFGPHYGPREAAREIVGLADPYVPPAWAPASLQKRRPADRLKFAVKRARMRACDEIWVESVAFAESLRDIGVPRNRITVVPNAVSRTVRAGAGVPARDLSESRPVRLFFPARPYPHKNHAIIAPMVRSLAARGFAVQIDVTLTEEERDSLLPGMRDAVRALGVLSLEEMRRAYDDADGVLFPTLLEVSSATPLEAMSNARPLLASDRPFVREQAGDAAWYFEPTDPESIADVVLAAFASAEARADKIAEGLRISDSAPRAEDRLRAFVNLIEGRSVKASASAPKVVVAHPAQQHSMRTAVAVKKAGADLLYCTPVYDRAGALTNRIKRLISRDAASRAEGRKLKELPDSDVAQPVEWMGLVLLLLQRISFSRAPFNGWLLLLDSVFGQRVARLAAEADMVIGYDTFSAGLFTRLARKSPRTVRVLDMSAPSAGYVEKVLAKAAADPGEDTLLRDSLDGMKRGLFARVQSRRAAREIALADHFLVASEFTALSLTEVGVDPARIHRCRYGAPAVSDVGTGGNRGVDGRLRVAFVGTFTARKGATTFLAAAAALGELPIDFVVMGQVPPGAGVEARPENVEFLGYVTKAEVLEQLSRTDVVVFSSFADGFGFSALEAMASGCALVCSRNAGVADLVVDGENGLLFDAGDVAAVVNHLNALERHRDELSLIAGAGAETARRQTWDGYYADVRATLASVAVQRESL